MPSNDSGKILSSIATGDLPVVETLTKMTFNTMGDSGLDARSYFLVRLAGLAAMDAAPMSYLLNATAASDVLEPRDLQGILIALAPVIGTARTAAAAGNMLRAYAVKMEMEEAAAE